MDIKLSIVQKIEDCFSLAENHFDCVLARPKVSFNIRGQDAGRAYFPAGNFFRHTNIGKQKPTEIKFNELLLEDNVDFFLSNIVPHECAHLIVYELFGTKVKPHGKEWKGLMENVFHIDSLVKHNLDVSAVSKKPFIYSCACLGEGIALSHRQHKTASKGGSYICRCCKSELTFKYEKLPSEKKSIDSKQVLEGFYLHFESDVSINDLLLKKIDAILGKKRPLKIFSSMDLSSNHNFQSWLRTKNLVRKYQGQITRPQLEEMLSKREISHAILLLTNKEFSERQYWEVFRAKGLVLRSISL